jgi:hypothetical protein
MTGSPPATATCANRSPACAYGTPDGWIVELQHSNLSVDEIGERDPVLRPEDDLAMGLPQCTG